MQRLAEAERAQLDVALPKVRLNEDYDLAPQLQSLGLRKAFDDGADISGVAEQSLPVSAVIEKTFLAIDEEGAEAAAVTAIDMRPAAAPGFPEALPIEFTADHPFFIVLRPKQARASVPLPHRAMID